MYRHFSIIAKNHLTMQRAIVRQVFLAYGYTYNHCLCQQTSEAVGEVVVGADVAAHGAGALCVS